MVISSDFRMGKHRDGDHKEHAPYFNIFWCCDKSVEYVWIQINIDEAPEKCAAREVDEEIGYDIGPLINKNDFIEVDLSG